MSRATSAEIHAVDALRDDATEATAARRRAAAHPQGWWFDQPATERNAHA